MPKDFDYHYSKKSEGAPWISGGACGQVDSVEHEVAERISDQTYKLDKLTVGRGVPSDWRLAEGQAENAYKTRLRAGVKLFEEMYAAALAVESLNKLGETISLPQGVKIEHNGGLPKPLIDLPNRLEDLNSDARVANYQHWLAVNVPRIKADAKEIESVKKNPYLEIESVDMALAPSTVMGKSVSKKAALDGAGRLIEIVDPALHVNDRKRSGSMQISQGQSELDIDVLKKRFDARRVNPTNPDSDVLVDVTVQAQKGRFGYDLFNENVGAPMLLEQRRYKADDMVFYAGRLVPARKLPDAEFRDEFFMAAGKSFDIALDSAMIYLGLSKLAKLSILRQCSPMLKADLPAATTVVAPEFGRKSLGIAAANALTETAMGTLGILANNKWGEANASWINSGRGIYFTGLCIGGLSRRFASTVSGGELLNGKLLETGPNWLRRADKVAETSMLASLPVQVGTVAYSTYEQVKRTLEHSQNSNAPAPATLAAFAARVLPDYQSSK